MKLRVYNILKSTKVEGPGIRYCIWVQGCIRRCKGCQAVNTWSHKAGTVYETKDIIKDIITRKNRIEGVTFLGGEPFEQAQALGEIAESVHNAGLSVLCFTGDYIENLRKNTSNQKLLSNIDLLIDGPYEDDKKDFSRPWCGSSNQRYHFLTNRYNEKIFTDYKNKIEINISKSGMIFMNGMGDFEDVLKKTNLTSI